MKRIVLKEGSCYAETVAALAKELRMDEGELITSLYAADKYLSKRLAITGSLHFERGRFAFCRLAGIFPVARQLEIEVVPKFMIGDESWRADFLLLLARSRWGVLVERQMVGASKRREKSISDSLAMVFLALFDRISHVPIRTYGQQYVHRFEIEDELEEESIILPEEDGFTQRVTEFTRRNAYNAIISEAARVLSRAVNDFDLRSRLERSIYLLGPQGKLPAAMPRFVPTRFRNWSDLYGLCLDILDGYGIDYVNQGEIMSPGFVVRTSDVWEEFIRQALLLGMKDCSVAFQEKHPFAKRDNSTVKVRPDYTLRAVSGARLLVDAKYKYDDASSGTISNADIYEGWAFMYATGIPRLVLLYPFSSNRMKTVFEEFQHIRDETKEIVGVRVNPELAGRKSVTHFAEELAMFIRPFMLHGVANG